MAITADKSKAVLCGQAIFAAERASCTGLRIRKLQDQTEASTRTNFLHIASRWFTTSNTANRLGCSSVGLSSR